MALTLLSCAAPAEPPKPAPRPSVSTSSTAPAPSPLPSALVVPSGIETREPPPAFAPAKGTVAVSCRGQDGIAADPPSMNERTFAKCKVPARARFVIRIDAGKTLTVRGVVDRENADEKVATCVKDALASTNLALEPISEERTRTYDCYVAFY